MVAIKEVINESGLDINNKDKISIILAHENPGVNNLTNKIIKNPFNQKQHNPEMLERISRGFF
ncbi:MULTISPECIES: hypothetical protein [Virgibacillus]|uniref:hypothetical protein n=1 Tax=Virgibacillus TaxID=84406 RepID=UPI0018413A5F|nr:MULTISPECIES: hypothetical protein [Virgibacillus]MBU5265960.1 hypothetical protein [Virgibacillus proomii]NWO15087.1 hypothetical protein [Virgibacillus sp.]